MNEFDRVESNHAYARSFEHFQIPLALKSSYLIQSLMSNFPRTISKFYRIS